MLPILAFMGWQSWAHYQATKGVSVSGNTTHLGMQHALGRWSGGHLASTRDDLEGGSTHLSHLAIVHDIALVSCPHPVPAPTVLGIGN